MKTSKTKRKSKKVEIDPLAGDLSNLLSKNTVWKSLDSFYATEFQPKDKTLTLRLSDDLMSLIRKSAEKQKIDIQKLIRRILIEKLAEAS